MAHRLISCNLGAGLSAIVLARENAASFIDKLLDNPRTRRRAGAITKAIAQVSKNGVEWAKQADKLKFLNAGLSLYELKIGGRVIRIMTYVHCDSVPVYLFDFNGHQGKSRKIPRHIMDRGEKLAIIAARLMTEEHND